MFNLPEILTILIGALLALVFIDGIRRALRIKNSSLKVDLIDPEDLQDTNKDFEETLNILNNKKIGSLDWIEYRKLQDGSLAFKEIHNGSCAAPKIVLLT